MLTKIIIIYLVVMNVMGFVVMFADKRRAIDHRWRIPEKTLFLVSLAGGSIGSLLGMYLLRHKTRHWYFVIGMPLILVLHIVLAYFLLFVY